MPGLFDQSSAGGGLFGGLSNFMNNMNPTTPIAQGIMGQRAMQATYQALQGSGVPEPVARAATLNPEILKQIAPAYFDTQPKLQDTGTDPLSGQHSFVWARPNMAGQPGGITPAITNGAPVQGGQPGQQQAAPATLTGILSSIEQGKNSGEARDQLLQRVPLQYRSAAQAMLNGESLPTNFSMRGQVRDTALNIAHAIDDTFSENDIVGRRKMYTDLNSSSPNSMGGIMANGKSAFGHLATAGEKMVDLGNYNVGGIGGGLAANAVNTVGNTLGSSATQGKISAVKDALGHYGQESTKFYAGTGGGEGERTAALNNNNPVSASGEQQASFIQTEKELMLERFAQKEAQIRQQLGDGYLQAHPLLGPRDQQNLQRIDAAIAKLRGGDSPTGSTVGAAPAFQEGVTATNQKTGQKIMFKGGQWQPVQ